MRNTLFAIILSVFLSGCVATPSILTKTEAIKTAEENDQANVWATYYVADMSSTKNDTIELWIFHPDPGDSDQVLGKLTKETFGKRKWKETETYTLWWNEAHINAVQTYYRWLYSQDLVYPVASISGFGLIEEMSVASKRVIENWPVFYTIEVNGGLYKATFKTFLRDGSVSLVIKEYGLYQYHFPFRETHLLSKGGKNISHFSYIRRDWR